MKQESIDCDTLIASQHKSGYKIYFNLKLIYYNRCSQPYQPRIAGHGGATLGRTYNTARTTVSVIDQDLTSRIIQWYMK